MANAKYLIFYLGRIHKSGNRFCDKDARKNNKLEHVYDSKNCKCALKSILIAGILLIGVSFGFSVSPSNAQAFNATPVEVSQKPVVNRLQDIQIGEKGLSTRIALFCYHQCVVERHIDGFKLLHIVDTLTIDLKSKSSNVLSLNMRPEESALVNPVYKASVLSIKSDQLILRSSLSQCRVSGREATCIDLEFSPQIETKDENANVARLPIPRQEVSLSAPPANQVEGFADQNRVLRDDRNQGSEVAAGQILQPGKGEQRVSPINTAALRDIPSTPAIPVPVSLPESLSGVAKSSPSVLRPAQVSLVLSKVDFREQAEKILGQRFDSENCSQAKNQLDGDAWALGAMVILGYCVGAAGDFEEADRVFKDIGGLVPTSYEAFVGRAIIASTTGETSIARRFFNKALSLDPPKTVTRQIEQLIN